MAAPPWQWPMTAPPPSKWTRAMWRQLWPRQPSTVAQRQAPRWEMPCRRPRMGTSAVVSRARPWPFPRHRKGRAWVDRRSRATPCTRHRRTGSAGSSMPWPGARAAAPTPLGGRAMHGPRWPIGDEVGQRQEAGSKGDRADGTTTFHDDETAMHDHVAAVHDKPPPPSPRPPRGWGNSAAVVPVRLPLPPPPSVRASVIRARETRSPGEGCTSALPEAPNTVP